MYKNLGTFLSMGLPLAIAAVLGVWGFYECGDKCGVASLTDITSLKNIATNTFNLVRGGGNYSWGQHPWQLVVAQNATPFAALWAMGQGYLITLRRDMRVALARRKADHTIICGLGDTGMQIVQNLRGAGRDAVVIDLVGDSPNALTCERQGIPVLKGDAKIGQVLRIAGQRKAKSIVVCTGDDAENIEIALRIKNSRGEDRRHAGKHLLLLVEMRKEWLFSRLLNHERGPLGSGSTEIRLFNNYANAARVLVNGLRPPPVPELGARTFAIVGFGTMGREAALHVIRAAPAPLGNKSKIIVFDREAEAASKAFAESNAAALELAEIEFVAADLRRETADMKHKVAEKLRHEPLLGAAVCLPDDDASLFVALEMRSLLDAAGQLSVPIFVRLEHHRRLGDFAGGIEGIAEFDDRLRSFGALEELLSVDNLMNSTMDALAQAFHDDYRNRPGTVINPVANVPWHDLPEFMKMSNRWRADYVPIMLALAGFKLASGIAAPAPLTFSAAETERLARIEHRRFTLERRLRDWQAGPARRHGHRVNPHLADWHELSGEQRKHNTEEVARLPGMLAKLGLEIRRERRIDVHGAGLEAAAAAIAAAAAKPDYVHYVVIADVDEPRGRAAADQAVTLPMHSLWLLSSEVPEGLFVGGRGDAAGKTSNPHLAAAEGWIARSRLPGA